MSRNSPTTSDRSLNNSFPSKVDRQVYTDAQSNGLTSRIVQYYNKASVNPNHKPLINHLYNRPGELPIVHLNKPKTELKRNRTDIGSKVSRIPPPITYYGQQRRANIYSQSIGSVIRKRTSEHDQPIQSTHHDYEPNPTRSVLDALKEISHKRIHCEDYSCEQMKKTKTTDLDAVDHSSNGFSKSNGTSTKRQRERISPDTVQKRQCTVSSNNDIKSSLSSSILLNRKCKRIDTDSEPVIQSARKRFLMSGNTDGKLKESISTPDSVTPPNQIVLNQKTPSPNQLLVRKPIHNSATTIISGTPVSHHPKPDIQPVNSEQLTLFNKKITPVRRPSQTKLNITKSPDSDGEDVSFVVPRIASSTKLPTARGSDLKSFEQSKLSLMLQCLSGGLDEPVKPIKSVKIDVTEPVKVIESTEVKENEVKATPIATVPKFGTTEPVNVTTIPPTSHIDVLTTKSTETVVKSIVVTEAEVVPPVVQPEKKIVTFGLPDPVPVTEKPTASIVFTPPAVPAIPVTQQPPESSTTSNKINIPSMPMFNFGSTATIKPPIQFGATLPTTPATTPSFTFDVAKDPPKTTVSLGFSTATTFSQGPVVSIQSATTTTESVLTPVRGGGFDGPKSVTVLSNVLIGKAGSVPSNPPPTYTPPVTTTPSFNFGPPTTKPLTFGLSPITTIAGVSPFNIAPPKTTSSSQPMFGIQPNQPATTVVPAVPTFGSISTTNSMPMFGVTTSTTSPPNLFTFGSNVSKSEVKPPGGTTNQSGMFNFETSVPTKPITFPQLSSPFNTTTFGDGSVPKPAVTIFGSQPTITSPPAQSIFGQPVPMTTQPSTFSFSDLAGQKPAAIRSNPTESIFGQSFASPPSQTGNPFGGTGGSGSTTNLNSTFSFGPGKSPVNNVLSPTGGTIPNNVFGKSTSSNETPAGGPTNIFGGTNSSVMKPSPSPFSFNFGQTKPNETVNINASTPSGMFGAATQSVNKIQSPPSGTPSASLFTFGSALQEPGNKSNNIFGTGSSTQSVTNNPFTAGTPSQTGGFNFNPQGPVTGSASSTDTVFNFNASGQGAGSSSDSNMFNGGTGGGSAPNLFNIGVGSSTGNGGGMGSYRGRPIRQATRRLHK